VQGTFTLFFIRFERSGRIIVSQEQMRECGPTEVTEKRVHLSWKNSIWLCKEWYEERESIFTKWLNHTE
jgi:hypothetical protein